MAWGWNLAALPFHFLCSPGNKQHSSRQIPPFGSVLTSGVCCIHRDRRNGNSMKASGIQGKEGEVAQAQTCLWLGLGSLFYHILDFSGPWLLVSLWACKEGQGAASMWWGAEICSLQLLHRNYLHFSFIFLIMGFSASSTQGVCGRCVTPWDFLGRVCDSLPSASSSHIWLSWRGRAPK